MGNLQMTPDEYQQLQRLLLKLKSDLDISLVNSQNIVESIAQLELYYFLDDLKQLIASNKNLLEDDLYMKLYYLRKKLVSHRPSN